MADGQSTTADPDLSTSHTRLDSISNEFKGILMDIHSSMMGSEEADASQAPPIKENEVGLGPGLALLEKCLTTSELFGFEPLAPPPVPPTLHNVDVEMSIEPSTSAPSGLPDWSQDTYNTFGSQIAGDPGGYISFGEPSQTNDEDGEPIPPGTEGFECGTVPQDNGENCDGVDGDVQPLQSKIKLYVTNVPTGFKNVDLSNLFQPYGNVVECEIFPYKNFAFVHLDNAEGGVQAIKDLNNLEICGARIKVMRSTAIGPNEKQEMKDLEVGTFKVYFAFMFNGVTKEFITKLVEEYGRIVEIEVYRYNSAFVHMEDEAAGRKVIAELNGKLIPEVDRPLNVSESKNPEGPSIPTIRLQVKNIAANATPSQIRSLFQPYGLVIKCTLSNSKFDLLRKADVLMEQLGDIRSALKDLNGYELNGNKLIVEPIFDKPSNKKSVPPNQFHLAAKPEYDRNNYGYEEYNPPAPLIPRSRGQGPPRGMLRGRGRGGLGAPAPGPLMPKYQLIPMPSMSEVMSRGRGGPRGMGMRGRGGRGRGGGRGMPPQHQGFVPRFAKRPYDNQNTEFVDDYSFDKYYEDPAAMNARDHYEEFEEEYAPEYEPQANFNSFGFPPPQKRPRGRGGGPGTGFAQRRPVPPDVSGSIPPLMGDSFAPAFDEDVSSNFEEDFVPVPYQSHSYPSLNLPLGEREYYKDVNKSKNYQMLSPANLQQQAAAAQRKQQMNTFPNYLVPEQIPGSSSNQEDFGYSTSTALTSYPSNYYEGVEGYDDFNAVPFDYNSIKRQRPNPNRNLGQAQAQPRPDRGRPPRIDPGINPADFPNLKPGARVYINKVGKVMVRGNRGGKWAKKKPRRPGLGSGGGNSTNADGTFVSGANQAQIGGDGYEYDGSQPQQMGSLMSLNPNPSSHFNSPPDSQKFPNKKYKSKEEVKQENQEYADWLQSKAWLHQAIPGTVKKVDDNARSNYGFGPSEEYTPVPLFQGPPTPSGAAGAVEEEV